METKNYKFREISKTSVWIAAAVTAVTIAVQSSAYGQEIIATDDEFIVLQGSSLPMSGATGILANDSGVDNLGAVRIYLTNPPAHGQLNFQADGTFEYIPNPNFHGVDRFTYAIEPATSPNRFLADRSDWRYITPSGGVPPDFDDLDFDQTWFLPDYDDALWLEGFGLMGYGNNEATTTIDLPVSGNRATSYFRAKFTSTEDLTGRLEALVQRDDAAIIYLNGVELLRSHESGAHLLANAPDDFFLPVEGNSSAWVSGEEEDTVYHVDLENFSLPAGEHLIAASVHNNLNPIAFTSSDLTFSLDLTLHEADSAEVLINVNENATLPSIEADAFFIYGDTDFNTANISRNLYTNDQLLNENGIPFTAISALVIDDSEAAGQVLSTSPATGDFIFRPEAGFRGEAPLSYQVTTAAGTSESRNIFLIVVDGTTSQELVQGRFRGDPTLNFSATIPAPRPSIGGVSIRDGRGTTTLPLDMDSPALLFEPIPSIGEQALDLTLQFETTEIIPPTATWSYLHPQNGSVPILDPPDLNFEDVWFLSEFDDAGWQTGRGQFAAGTINGAATDTPLPLPASGFRYGAYFRHRFNVEAAQSGQAARLLISADDGAIIYLNGIEIGRFPTNFVGEDRFTLLTPNSIGGDAESAVQALQIPAGMLLEGQNLLAISVHNASNTSSDLGFRCGGLLASGEQIDIPLTFETVSPTGEWTRDQFSPAQLLDPSISAPTSDPDSDGLVNLVEHVYSTNPLVADDRQAVLGLGLDTADITTFQPLLSIPLQVPGDTIIELQESSTLSDGTWRTVSIRYPRQGWITVGINVGDTIPFVATNDERRFFRFKFTLMPWATDVPS